MYVFDSLVQKETAFQNIKKERKKEGKKGTKAIKINYIIIVSQNAFDGIGQSFGIEKDICAPLLNPWFFISTIRRSSKRR